MKRWRWQKVNGIWRAPQEETVDSIPCLTAAVSPQALPSVNRDHWGIAIMQRNKDIILGADSYANRGDNAPPRWYLPHNVQAQTHMRLIA